jgi:hypothetical protein
MNKEHEMKGTFKFFSVFLAAALVLMACPNPAGEEDSGSGVSFESFSPPSIYVDNKSGENLIAFKGSLNPNYLISGIPAYASDHGLEKKPSLFSTTGDFALILVTEAEYIKNKNNIASAPVFARIYAFYNHEATNNNRFQISSFAGGTGRITLNNPTNWNIEIRKDGPTGEILGYVAAQMTNTVLRVDAPADYTLFPVFKRYIPTDKEIFSVIPKYLSGNLTGIPYSQSFALTQADSTDTWNLGPLAGITEYNLTSGSFYFRIINNAGTAVRFTRGTEEQITSVGIRGTPSGGRSETFSIKIEQNPDKTYPAQQTFAGLKIGTPQFDHAVPEYTFKTDYLYTITVSGPDASNLTLGEITEVQKLDINAMFGGN